VYGRTFRGWALPKINVASTSLRTCPCANWSQTSDRTKSASTTSTAAAPPVSPRGPNPPPGGRPRAASRARRRNIGAAPSGEDDSAGKGAVLCRGERVGAPPASEAGAAAYTAGGGRSSPAGFDRRSVSSVSGELRKERKNAWALSRSRSARAERS
jgi:hypothetical protein